MKRVALMIAIFLFAFSCCSALSDQSDFDIQGEWYIGLYYSNETSPVIVEEDGSFLVSISGYNYLCHSDGIIEYDGKQEQYNSIIMPCGAVLLYNTSIGSISKKEVMSGILIFPSEDGYKSVSVSEIYQVLLLNGRYIRYDIEDAKDYYVSGQTLYLTDGATYIRGSYVTYDDSFFIYEIESEPVTYMIGDYEVNYGTPVMFFLRSSIAG